MKYYQVGITGEPKIMGVKNGLHQIEIDKKGMLQDGDYKVFLDFFSSSNVNFWNIQKEIRNIKIPVIKAKLLKNAKVTDIMGYTPNISFLSKVFSEKYINMLKSFNTGNHVIFEVKIEDVIEKYYLLFHETIRLDEINYEKSIVYTGHKLRNNIEYHIIKNRKEYGEFLERNPLGGFEKISISKVYLEKDIINIQASGNPFYSEKLIDFLLDCGITNLAISYNNSIELDFY